MCADQPKVDTDRSATGLDEPERPLADELRRIVAIRTPKALQDAHFPALSELLHLDTDPDVRGHQLRAAITAAIPAIPDGQFRDAADALFGFTDHRWSTLGTRGELASAPFGCSFDAFRRARRSTGTSLLDETVFQLAAALVACTTTAPLGTETVTATDLHEPAVVSADPPDRAEPSPSRWIPIGVAGIVIVALVSGAIAFVASRNTSSRHTAEASGAPSTNRAQSVSAGSCVHPIGKTADSSLAVFHKPFVRIIDQLTPPGDAEPCGAGPVERWDDLVIQPLTDDDRPGGTIVAIDPDHLLVMTRAEFTSYHQIGGKDGSRAQEVQGLPRRRGTSPSGRAWLIHTDNGVLASEGVDQPGFYVGGPAWTRWKATGLDTGEMGMVASNPLSNAVGYFQDFANGRLTLTYSGSLNFHEVDDPGASVPSNVRGNILRNDDGTTWYVDEHDVRHWIPDGGTWECLTGRGATEIGHVPGYAILTLSLGDPAECSPDS